MITAASLKSQTVKDLSQLAKKMGLPGWHQMRKDQLVRALVKAAKANQRGRAGKSGAKGSSAQGAPARRSGSAASRSTSSRSSASRSNSARAKSGSGGRSTAGRNASTAKRQGSGASRSSSTRTRSASQARSAKSRASKGPTSKAPVAKKPAKTAGSRRVRKANAEREKRRDLSQPQAKSSSKSGERQRDRIVLLVRDPYWLQAFWEVTRQSVLRAKAAMAEQWHAAHPVLRLLEVDSGNTTSTSERVARDIQIHGGVSNWYVDVPDPPQSYRVAIGYLAANGEFFCLARSNTVTTPRPGSSDDLDENWTDVAENYEKIYAQSGGYDEESGNGELRELFEERLRRPMGSPVVTRYGLGAEGVLNRQRDFEFHVDAEMIVFGQTKPDAHVTLAGEPVKLRPDGTFTLRVSMPDRRQVLPVVACSSDGLEERTIVLAVERNTKVMEPVVRESNE